MREAQSTTQQTDMAGLLGNTQHNTHHIQAAAQLLWACIQRRTNSVASSVHFWQFQTAVESSRVKIVCMELSMGMMCMRSIFAKLPQKLLARRFAHWQGLMMAHRSFYKLASVIFLLSVQGASLKGSVSKGRAVQSWAAKLHATKCAKHKEAQTQVAHLKAQLTLRRW